MGITNINQVIVIAPRPTFEVRCPLLPLFQFNYLPKKMLIRALALKNANAIFKTFLTFYGSKCAASKDAKHRNCKKFYNSATVEFNL